MIVLQVCAYGADYPGNFISALKVLEKNLKKYNIETIYVFIERAKNREWCLEIQKTNKVYFLPEKKARILPKTYQMFKKIYKENKIDVVHSHFELYDIPATICAPANIKVFWHLHDPMQEYYNKEKFSRKILMKIQYKYFGKRAYLLSVSKLHGEFVCKLGFSKNRLIIYPNGINTQRITNAYKVQHKIEKFLIFGWDIKRKAVDVLCEAEKKLDDLPIKIIVVGNEECKNYIKRNNRQKVEYSIPMNDVNMLYQNNDVFLHISRSEGLSYALLEAVYAGMPIICSDIDENSFARKFKGINFVKTGDPNDLAEIMKRMVLFGNDFSEVDVEYNRMLIEKQYSLRSWANGLIKLYGVDISGIE